MKNVSIIVPVYNKEKYLKKCVDSILQQTYSNYEIILVDDGSNDKSGEICDEYEKNVVNIRALHQENKGQIAARHIGVEQAVGEYIMFIDADDWIDAFYLEEMISRCGGKSFDIVTSALQYEGEGKSWTAYDMASEGIYFSEKIHNVILPKYIYDFETQKSIILHSMSNKLFNKKCIRKALERIPKRMKVYEDGVAVFSSLLEAETMLVTHIKGYHYIQYVDSTIHGYNMEDCSYIQTMADEYRELATGIIDKEQLDAQITMHVGNCYIRAIANQLNANYEYEFIIPWSKIEGKDVIVYGAGVKGRELYSKLISDHRVHVCGWVDKNYINIEGTSSPESLQNAVFDYILIAIESAMVSREVVSYLLTMGIEFDKIWQLDKEKIFVTRK